MVGWMFDQAAKWLQDLAADTLNAVWRLVVATLFHLPDVTRLPQVQELTARSLTVVNITYVLLIISAGVVTMTHGSLQQTYSARELLPRLCFGIVIANYGTWITTQALTAGNALIGALAGPGIADPATLGVVLKQASNGLGAGLFLTVIIQLFIDVLVVLLLVGWITRFVSLILVAGTAPIALACHGTPWTQPIAALWWKTLGGLIATVILQAVALQTSLAIWLHPGHDLSTIGWPFDPDGILNQLVVAVLLWFTIRIPALVRQHITGSGGRTNVLGMIVRLVVVQQVTRGLGRNLGRGLGMGGRPGPRGPGFGRPPGPPTPPGPNPPSPTGPSGSPRLPPTPRPPRPPAPPAAPPGAPPTGPAKTRPRTPPWVQPRLRPPATATGPSAQGTGRRAPGPGTTSPPPRAPDPYRPAVPSTNRTGPAGPSARVRAAGTSPWPVPAGRAPALGTDSGFPDIPPRARRPAPAAARPTGGVPGAARTGRGFGVSGAYR